MVVVFFYLERGVDGDNPGYLPEKEHFYSHHHALVNSVL